MTGFIMRCCKSRLDLLIQTIMLAALCLCSTVALAEGITIIKADARLVEEGLQLSANFDVKLSYPVETALMSGVTLHFVSELAVNRSRWYWFDTDVTREEQIAKLSYNALTRQYRVTRGSLFQSFYDLSAALHVLGHQIAAPVPLSELDKGGGGYFSRLMKKGSDCCSAYARMRFDVSRLPKPLQVNALTNDDWKLESSVHRWEIDPALLQQVDEE